MLSLAIKELCKPDSSAELRVAGKRSRFPCSKLIGAIAFLDEYTRVLNAAASDLFRRIGFAMRCDN